MKSFPKLIRHGPKVIKNGEVDPESDQFNKATASLSNKDQQAALYKAFETFAKDLNVTNDKWKAEDKNKTPSQIDGLRPYPIDFEVGAGY